MSVWDTRNVDRLQWFSSTLAGALSLVGVSAEFGTWRGMLIGCGRSSHLQLLSSHRLALVVW